MSPKIRHQLHLETEGELLDYYGCLGLDPDSSDDDIQRAYNRAREILTHLEYHPRYREEAKRISKQLENVSKILGDPESRREYDRLLEGVRNRDREEKRGEFRELAESCSMSGALSPQVKKELLSYADFRNVDPRTAREILEAFPETDDRDSPPIGSVPTLTAPIHKYLETQAFSIILEKNLPLLKKINRLSCPLCGNKVPITHLMCSCGGLMRGKMICLDCEAVFPSTNVECPSCKKESHLLLQLSNEDLGKIEKQIEHLKQTGRTQTALTLSRDLLSMIPSSDVARKSIGELEETERRGKTGKTLEELETRAKEAWEKDRYSLARKYLLEYLHIAPLAPESKAILEEASLRIRKGKKRTVRFLFILGGIFLLAGVAAGVAGTMSHSPECFLCGFCLLIAGLLLLPIAGIYLYLVKKKYKMDPGQKSLDKT